MVDRSLWKEWYEDIPDWPCPSCVSGQLIPIKDVSVLEETPTSVHGRDHPEWDFDWIDMRFSEQLRCSSRKCSELCILIGRAGVDMVYSYAPDGTHEQGYGTVYKPVYMFPGPAIIRPNTDTPEDVVNEIRRASATYWSDTSSSAHKLRIATERILTALKVDKTFIDKNGKTKTHTLYSRLLILKKTDQDIFDLLDSIRFLGNHGSHEEDVDVSRDDLLDAFQIIDVVLDEVFSTRTSRAKKAAKSISQRRGKPDKKSRRRRTI